MGRRGPPPGHRGVLPETRSGGNGRARALPSRGSACVGQCRLRRTTASGSARPSPSHCPASDIRNALGGPAVETAPPERLRLHVVVGSRCGCHVAITVTVAALLVFIVLAYETGAWSAVFGQGRRS